MGQASSYSARADAGASPEGAPTSSSLRRALGDRSNARRHDDMRSDLLNRERRSRVRSSGIQRLSQLFHSHHDALHISQQAEDPISYNGTSRQRTRSLLQDMLRRDIGRPSSQRSNIQQPPIHTPSVNSTSRQSHGEIPPPRLPSIDLSSTFDYEATSTRSGLESVPRSETSSRRSNLRLNSLRPDRSFRQFTSSLRRRNSPQPSLASIRPRGSEDQAAMLSRLLSVAAAATAATLMGDDHHALSEARSLTGNTGVGGEDGSFDGFLRALQNGRIASALRQGSNEGDGETLGNTSAPLNFFRMFRFGASNISTLPTSDSPPLTRNSTEFGEGRMVPIIIVGIRSINPNSTASSSNDDLPPFIDALHNFPSPIPAHALGTHAHDSIDSMLRPPQNGTSFRHRRRASMGGLGSRRSRIGEIADDVRDRRNFDRRRERPWSVASAGPHLEPRPPPATPASPSPELSRISSRSSTPTRSRRASSTAHGIRDLGGDASWNDNMARTSGSIPLNLRSEASLQPERSGHSAVDSLEDRERLRIHRRSDTGPNIHYPRFASGHPRRNGVVEPDTLPPLTRSSTSNGTESSRNEGRNGSNDSRSWIIYVLGGSYPENHPILTTPSLFTENPTYEDMMLLSALLGPAKAPVASEEDVENAGGVYHIGTRLEDSSANVAQSLIAASTKTDRLLILDAGQRCLVCLCEFEPEETVRELIKCKHLFHKECIDQWLTTGRNSCPLCREQGVDEKMTVADIGESSGSTPFEDTFISGSTALHTEGS